MPRPRPGWVPSERQLRAQGKALRKIAAEQKKIARVAGVTARNQRKLARIQRQQARDAQKAAQSATREARQGERTHRDVNDSERPVQAATLPVLPDRRELYHDWIRTGHLEKLRAYFHWPDPPPPLPHKDG